MLKEQLRRFINKYGVTKEQNINHVYIDLLGDEIHYCENHRNLFSDVTIYEKSAERRFSDAYIERCEKATEDMLSQESPVFLENQIKYLYRHKNEFIYLESRWFEIIGVDGMSLEVDDVFGTYNAMLGLKLPKKYGEYLIAYLKRHLINISSEPEIVFNQNDGLWDINIPLRGLNGFQEDMTLEDAYNLLYHFLFELVVTIEEVI